MVYWLRIVTWSTPLGEMTFSEIGLEKLVTHVGLIGVVTHLLVDCVVKEFEQILLIEQETNHLPFNYVQMNWYDSLRGCSPKSFIQLGIAA